MYRPHIRWILALPAALALMSFAAADAARQDAGEGAGEIAFARDGGVWIIDLETGAEREIAHPGYDRPLTWSPDGRFLIWWDHRSGGWDLWRADIDAGDGAVPVNLTPDTTGGCRFPGYSPNGRQIAFMRDDPPGLWLMNADGSNMRRLSEHGHRDVQPQWSPDGTRLLFVELAHEGDQYLGPRLRLFDLETGEDRALMSGDSPQWLSDDRLLFESKRNGRSAIVASDLDGSNEVIISAAGAGDGRADAPEDSTSPILSPDRSRIAWIKQSVRLGMPMVMTRSATAEAGGENAQRPRALAALRGDPQPPLAWSPDGRRLAIAISAGDSPGLFIISIGVAGDIARFTEGEVTWPTWRPRSSASD